MTLEEQREDLIEMYKAWVEEATLGVEDTTGLVTFTIEDVGAKLDNLIKLAQEKFVTESF